MNAGNVERFCCPRCAFPMATVYGLTPAQLNDMLGDAVKGVRPRAPIAELIEAAIVVVAQADLTAGRVSPAYLRELNEAILKVQP